METENTDKPASPAIPQPFLTPAAKFVAMSLCTFGLYEIYWSYKNWQFVRDRDGSEILPFWRAAFYPLWHYSLLGKLCSELQSKTLSSRLYKAFLAISLIGLNALWRLPDPYWLLSFLTFLPFLPALSAGNKAGASFRPPNLVAYFLGGPLLVFISLSSIGFLPSTAVVTENKLWNRDIEYLREAEILGQDEQIVFFYSTGLWSIKEDGQFISNEYVTSYWQDPEDDQTHIEFVSYNNIDNIKVVWAEGFLDMTVVTITTNEDYEFDIWLSSEAGGDKKFVNSMRRFRNASKYLPKNEDAPE
jgi:hypothetical protein